MSVCGTEFASEVQVMKQIWRCKGADGCAQGPKRRKATDRRASKGRKLRYHVHEKLVNFMTPSEAVGTAPGLASQLFSSLFGRALS